MQEIIVIRNSREPVNPKVVGEVIVNFEIKGKYRIRLVVLVAEDDPLPYFLVQIYDAQESEGYILNHALYPKNQSMIDKICAGEIDSFDVILCALSIGPLKEMSIFRVGIEEGQQWITYLDTYQLEIGKIVNPKLRDALIKFKQEG